MLTVTKRFHFCYGHHLPGHQGKCKNFHGHNCILEVTVYKKGSSKKSSEEEFYLDQAMVMDFGDLKKVVNPLIEKLDHQNINEVLPEKYLPSTAENMCLWFLDMLVKEGIGVDKIRIYETPDNWATWSSR